MSHTFGYSREFDGLRGISIVLVMTSHLGILAIAGGIFGVDIFFVLSGFLITTLLVAEFDNSGSRVSFKHFYIRRALRLGPALALLLVAYLTLGAWVGKDPASYGWRALIALCYMSNWVNAFGLFNMRELSHTWSLSIEEQFYIVWPVILVAVLRWVKDRRKIMLILAAVVLRDGGAQRGHTARPAMGAHPHGRRFPRRSTAVRLSAWADAGLSLGPWGLVAENRRDRRCGHAGCAIPGVAGIHFRRPRSPHPAFPPVGPERD
jgi:hypothetical protein